jgi:endonuclease/exonuclease/phosphatase family metal-dependent hydrolase
MIVCRIHVATYNHLLFKQIFMKRLNLLFFVLALVISFGCNSQNQHREMKVASYNIRNDNSGDAKVGNGWVNRCPVIVDMITFHDWDIVGTQECKVNQVADLRNALAEYNYDVIGRGRGANPTDDEFSAIFYKTDRYELLDHGDFWLSETPDVPSKGWDAVLNRICTWGHFKEKSSGFEFYAFNLHFDHVGVQARRESAGLVVQKIKDLAKGKPTVLTGDFNVDQHSESYDEFVASEILTDSYTIAPIKLANNGTFNDFSIKNTTSQRIDHIFVTSNFTVTRYGVLTDIYWTNASGVPVQPANFPKEVSVQEATPRLPSDHYPIVAGLKY